MNLEVPIFQGTKSTEFPQFLNLNVSTAFLGKIAKNIQFAGFSQPAPGSLKLSPETAAPPELIENKKATTTKGCLGYIGHEILPCYMGIIRNL